MAIVNKKLGNGFLINPVDSSKDQDHYFTGYKKHISMDAVGELTGALFTVYSSGTLADSNSYQLLDIAKNSSGTLYAVGFIPFRGVVLKSTDHGENWTTSLSVVSATFCSVKVSSSDKVYVAGISGSEEFAVLFSSSNHGTNWGLVFNTASVTESEVQNPRIAIASNSTIAFSAVTETGRTLKIFTSSLGGASGTYGQVNSITLVNDSAVCNDLLYSGSSLFLAGGSSFTASIHSASNFGSAAFGEVFIPAPSFANSVKKLFIDSSGTMWAGGRWLMVYSNGGGRKNTWVTSSQSEFSSSTVQNIVQDFYGNKILIANNSNGDGLDASETTTIYTNLSGDLWVNAGTFEAEIVSSAVGSDKYKNLIVCGLSGNFAKIWDLPSFSTVHRAERETQAILPCELVYGLRFQDSRKEVKFTDKELQDYFAITGKQVKTYDFSLAFSFSGSYNHFQEVKTNDLVANSGTWTNVIDDGIVTALVPGDLSSSFETGKIVNHPTVGYIRIRLSSSNSAQNLVTVRDVQFDYLQPMTDTGVRFFKNIENQQLQFANLNQNIVKKVE